VSGFLWFLLFLLGSLVLAYERVSLLTTTFVYGAALLVYIWSPGTGNVVALTVLWLGLAILVFLNINSLRIRFISRPFLRTYRRMLPSMSQTDRVCRQKSRRSSTVRARSCAA